MRSKFELERGDILITNGTSMKGLTGYTGIALDNETILHIAGLGKNPSTITISEWIEKYNKKNKWTKIYRYPDSDIASSAADWAEETYKDSNSKYEININKSSTDKTYCSKIVWQAYYFGGGIMEYGEDTIVLPYELPNLIPDIELIGKYK